MEPIGEYRISILKQKIKWNYQKHARPHRGLKFESNELKIQCLSIPVGRWWMVIHLPLLKDVLFTKTPHVL